MKDDERSDWAAFAALHCLRGGEKAAFLGFFAGDAHRALSSGPAAWRDAGMPAPLAEALERERDLLRARALLDLRRAREAGAVPVAAPEVEMPPLLREIPGAPLLLYRSGGPGKALHGGRAVALVGARRATDYGMHMARTLGGDLGARGLCIVSGAARGVDASAHRGALERGGETAAVLGCGIDVVYPREHGALLREIAASGGVWTEFPPGTSPRPGNFPVRNRLIAGLSRAIVVVEASEKSGSLITARCAAEQGRDVLAVPSNATSVRGRGSNLLLRDGARPVLGADDVLEELDPGIRSSLATPVPAPGPDGGGGPRTPEETALLRALPPGTSLDADGLALAAGLSVERALRALLSLELRGDVIRRDGSRFLRAPRLQGFAG